MFIRDKIIREFDNVKKGFCIVELKELFKILLSYHYIYLIRIWMNKEISLELKNYNLLEKLEIDYLVDAKD